MVFFVAKRLVDLKGLAFLAVILTAGLCTSAAQISPPKDIEPPKGIEIVGVPLAAWVASRDHALPDTLPDFATDEARRKSFALFVQALVDKDWNAALSVASSLSYQLVAIQEKGNWFVVASDHSGAGRDPTIVINLAPRLDAVFEAPHASFERGTAEQAVVLLRELGGRAAVISGAHRCASRKFTACDGRTAVCGTLEAYRDSDPGHNTDALFHLVHTTLAERWKDAVVFSLHGMKEDNDGIRTSLIISNGIRAPDRDQTTVATKLRRGLDSQMTPPGTVVSCNWPADEAYNYRKLCGYTNVQGRQINGDPNACRESVDQGTGRFIHMEQDWSLLKPYAQNWPQIERHPIGTSLIRVLENILPPI